MGFSLPRLNVLPISLPPLRERQEDIPLFIERFLASLARPLVIALETMELLLAYAWPGNVRELRNLVVRWVRFATDNLITPGDLPPEMNRREPAGVGLRSFKKQTERESLQEVWEKTGGSVSQAAQSLGISRVTLYRKIKEYNLRRPGG